MTYNTTSIYLTQLEIIPGMGKNILTPFCIFLKMEALLIHNYLIDTRVATIVI